MGIRLRCSFAYGLSALVAILVTLVPASTTAQVRTAPVQHLRNQAEVQVMAGVSGDGSLSPSFRMSLQRRQTLRRSVILSGLFLQDELSRSAGAALGSSLALPVGTLLVEPFVEVGGVMTDARVDAGSYEIVGTGAVPVTVNRYRAVEGLAGVGGAGLSLSRGVGERASARFMLGYWHLAGSDGLSRGQLRLGVSLGAGRRDARWSALATDRTVPFARFMGRHTAEADSVEVGPDGLLVVAADANGIDRILVNSDAMEFTRADQATAQRMGLDAGAVAARIPVQPPFGGQALDVVVRDSAGITTRTQLRAFPSPDRDDPSIEVLEGGDSTRWSVQVLADDFSGIAEASVGFCPLQLGMFDADIGAREDLPTTSRMVVGWGDFAPGSTLTITDRSGNARELAFDPSSPSIGNGAAPPELRAEAALRPAEDGSRIVRIRGSAYDPSGGWFRSVTADGQALTLRARPTPSQVDFEGWLAVSEGATSAQVDVATMDGRVSRQVLSFSDLEMSEESRLHVLVVAPGAENDEDERLRRLADVASAGDATVLAGPSATPERIVQTLVGMQTRLRPGDAVLIRLEGRLAADPTANAPSLVVSGGEVQILYLDRLIRALTPGVTLVSADIGIGHTWRTPLRAAPGAAAPPGCVETRERSGTVLDLGATAMDDLLQALDGAADMNADGRITAGELRSRLGLAPGQGITAFDPATVVAVVGVGR